MKRSSLLIVLIALLALGVGAWFMLRPRLSLPVDPLTAVPADSYAVLAVQVDHVLASEAYKRLIVDRGQAAGVERVTKLCGFNPLAKVREVVVFARPSPQGGMPRFGFTARGDFPHEDLLECVKKVSGKETIGLKRDDIEGIPSLVSSQGTSRVAFVGTDGIIAGDAESVRAAIHTLLGQAPSLASDQQLSGLFHEVQSGTDLALVGRIPEELRPVLHKLASNVMGGRLLPLADILAMSSSVSLAGGRIAGGTVFVTQQPARAQAVVTLARTSVGRLLDIPGIGFTPAASVLRGIQMEARGDQATFAGSIKVSTLDALLELVPTLGQLQGLIAPDGASAADGAQPAPDAAATTPVLEQETAPAPVAPKRKKPSKPD